MIHNFIKKTMQCNDVEKARNFLKYFNMCL